FRRPAKLKPRHEEADRARAPPGQGGGHRISHELPPFQDLQDPGAGLGAHVGLLIENPRDGGPGDARFACDIVNGESDFARHSSSILNAGLRAIGLSAIPWLRSPAWAMPSIILLGVWIWLGLNALYFLAGLQNIDQEYYEAAA